MIPMRSTLARKTLIGLLSVLLLATASSGLALLLALRANDGYKDLITENLRQANAINELVVALVEERGYAASYLLDGSSAWLDDLARRHAYVQEWLDRSDAVGFEPDQAVLVDQIRAAITDYTNKRDEVIALYGAGDRDEAGRVFQQEVSSRYDVVYRLSQSLLAANNRDIENAVGARHAQTQKVGLWVGVCLVLLAGFVTALAWLFLGGIFRPLQKMAEDIREYLGPEQSAGRQDEVQTLGSCIQVLKSNVAEARSNLARSHQRLLDAEKLATVGRLAAGVAHEIRSPLTSLRLRLYSMQKALQGDSRHQNDVRVMSEEITRLDHIIRNFLEFSRPPELRIQRCDVTLLLDTTLELLRFKIEAGNIHLVRETVPEAPPLEADPQQLRQVLINLLNNAIDAQPSGGSIRLTVAPTIDSGGQAMVVVRVRDGGPGIPKEIAGRAFDPFVTTKSDGAGLGLWIAHRIMAQHGGALELEESTEKGTVFAVWIPTVQGIDNEQDTGRGRRPERTGRL